MSASIRIVTASDGYPFHVRHYPAIKPHRGIVIGLHGIQSHGGWYERSSLAIAAAGFELYFADRRGSGLNSHQRGHADHGLRLIQDVRQTVRMVRAEHGSKLPLILMSVSWGGKIAAATAAMDPDMFAGLALLYPGLEPRVGPTGFQLRQLKLARHFDVRHREVPVPLSDPALFTDNEDARRFIASDPLALHTVTSGFLNSGRDLDQICRTQGHRIVVPTLLMLAGRDRIIDNDRTKQRVAQFGIRHLSTVTFPTARHTLEFEPPDSGFVSHLIAWLQRCAAGDFCLEAPE